MLVGLGLSDSEEAVYRTLLARPSGSTAELAAVLGRSSAEVAIDIGALTARGLAAQSGGDPGRFAAAPPAIALGALLAQRHEELRVAEVAVASLAEEHRLAVAGRTVSDLIEVVTGAEAVRQRFLQVQHAAREEIRSFVTMPPAVVPFEENTAERSARARGVRFRVVLERAVLTAPGATADAEESIAHGAGLRVVEELPIKMVVADNELGLVPLLSGGGGEPGAVVLHESGLLTGMVALFEQVWTGAYPLRLSSAPASDGPRTDTGTDTGTAPSAGDRAVLTLLLAGLTDNAIAGQLGLSERTVQRRIRHLMQLAGVQTRVQLGWSAARHDWPDPPSGLCSLGTRDVGGLP